MLSTSETFGYITKVIDVPSGNGEWSNTQFMLDNSSSAASLIYESFTLDSGLIPGDIAVVLFQNENYYGNTQIKGIEVKFNRDDIDNETIEFFLYNDATNDSPTSIGSKTTSSSGGIVTLGDSSDTWNISDLDKSEIPKSIRNGDFGIGLQIQPNDQNGGEIYIEWVSLKIYYFTMSSPKDNNYIPTSLALLNTDGETSVAITADPSTHFLDVDDNTSGSDNGGSYSKRDENYTTTMTATDANGDIIALYADSDGKLLIDSN